MKIKNTIQIIKNFINAHMKNGNTIISRIINKRNSKIFFILNKFIRRILNPP
jgi:ribosomal protein L31E